MTHRETHRVVIEGVERDLIATAGGEVVGEAAIFTEGAGPHTDAVVSLGHLPVFPS